VTGQAGDDQRCKEPAANAFVHIIRNFRSVFAMNRSRFGPKITFDPAEQDPIRVLDPTAG
jgi:hypothetical protein